jgi:TRAP-type C4-dicarboxylate transport system permease small subunit
MGTAPPDKLGVVSGMLALTRTLGQSTGIAIIGAIWAALTLSYSGADQAISATDAPVSAQVSALQNTFIFTSSIILFALLLALWALLKERQMRANQPDLEDAPTVSE